MLFSHVWQRWLKGVKVIIIMVFYLCVPLGWLSLGDNEGVVTVVQKRCAKDDLLIHFLRCLCFYGTYFRFDFSASHVPGVLNTAADILSRDNVTLFSSLFPQVPLIPVPPLVLDLLLHQAPKWSCPRWTELFRASLLRDFHQPR